MIRRIRGNYTEGSLFGNTTLIEVTDLVLKGFDSGIIIIINISSHSSPGETCIMATVLSPDCLQKASDLKMPKQEPNCGMGECLEMNGE